MKTVRLIGLLILLCMVVLPLLVEAEKPEGVTATLHADGERIEIYSRAETVAEALRDNQIDPEAYDSLFPAPTSDFIEGMNIFIRNGDRGDLDRRWDRQVEERRISSSALPAGRELVIQGGSPGKDGSPRVILEGNAQFRNRRLKEVMEKGSMTMVATAYSPHFLDTAPYTDGYSAVGLPAEYGLIAVDPRVIPLGTLLYVEGYGYGIAADVGGAIKGNRVDLLYNSREDALQFGRQVREVHILG